MKVSQLINRAKVLQALRVMGSIAGLLVFIFVLNALFSAVSRPETSRSPGIAPTPSSTSVDVTADWPTYRNERFGYAVRHPPDARVVSPTLLPPGSELEQARVIQIVMGNASLTIEHLDNPLGLGAQVWVSQMLAENELRAARGEQPLIRVISREDTKIGEIPAYQLIVSGIDREVQHTYVGTGQSMFQISLDTANNPNNPDSALYYSLFRQILATFAFSQ